MLLDAAAAYASDDVPWLLDPRFDGLLDECGAATVARVREVAEAVRLTSHGDPATWAPVLRALESIGLAER